jgi:2-iminobutanoate/2-iminopropanoate deaminase
MQVVSTEKAPKAIGPYSQAIIAGDYIFTAGQVGMEPATTNLVAGGIAEQTERALQNLTGVLEAAGSNLQQVVKTTVFLVDMADFTTMNGIYERHFGSHRPARSTVAVAQLPKNARVEIEVVALKR